MLTSRFLSLACALVAMSISSAQPARFSPAFSGPTPSPRQLAWHKMGYYAFVHFGPNTFSGQEWGHGTEDPNSFNPEKLDCRQWVKTFKAAGMKGVVITAKHHDGFCLWPSKQSKHTVAQSKWRNGKGDVLKDLSEACREAGLKFGVYVSPWDRNHPAYGTPEYNQIFAKTLEEVLTNYGEVFEVWFDGANGEGPNGRKQVYDWNLFHDTVRRLQPKAVMFSDAGPDIRWVGNESGVASETNWNTIDRDRYVPGTPLYKELGEGKEGGTHWVPAEVDVSIRPGWFWRASENAKVKSVDDLEKIYYESVGRGSNLLLNVPPNSDGRISEPDVKSLIGLRKRLDATFKKPVAKIDSLRGKFEDAVEFDVVELAEDLRQGQRVREFRIETDTPKGRVTVAQGTTIGSGRLLRFPAVRAQGARLIVESASAPVQLSKFRLYASPRIFAAEVASRVERDQKARSVFTEGAAPNPKDLDALMEIDRVNTAWLESWVDAQGWPKRSVYGKTAANHAWLLVQHADQNKPFQKMALRLMKPLLAEDEVSKTDYAYLTDRVLRGEGKPQLYGTQWASRPDGSMEMQPTSDLAGLEARRAGMGMPTIAAYRKMLEDAYKVKTADPATESRADRDKRMAWWRDARFGMFIHWGLYSIPAGTWNGKVYGGASEWLMNSAKIKPQDWDPLQAQFNPVDFDAKRWVQIAKDAGMKYIVITSKHHEGFAMYPSKIGTWNIGHTQFKRDPLKELAEECKKHGLKLCFYHSILDWHHPDYQPRPAWDDRPVDSTSYPRYVEVLKAQLKELLTNYGPIGILWFDGEWDSTWTHELGVDLEKYVKSFQPGIIVNNRVGKGRDGMAGFDKGMGAGDYGTPEQEIPASGLPSVDWESCMTMNNSWGFHANDNNWKSADTLIQNLVDCASKGGNFLLNVGPTSLGEIPGPSVDRLAEVGKWLKTNGEAVYGTSAGPFAKPLPWGKATRKGNRLYLAVFDSTLPQLAMPGLSVGIKRAYLLSDAKKKALEVVQGKDGIGINLPKTGEKFPVVVVEMTGEPTVREQLLRADPAGNVSLGAAVANATGGIRYEAGEKKALGFWTSQEATVSWTFEATQLGEYEVEVELACEPESAGSPFEVVVEGAKVSGKVPDTGSWSTFKAVSLGKLPLIHLGKTKLEVRALGRVGYGVMNLRAVRLRKA